MARGSYRELVGRAAERAGENPAGAALAWLGAGPVYDLVAAARKAAAEGWPEARTLARRASHALLRTGASSLAEELDGVDGGPLSADEQAPISRWRAAETLVSEAATAGAVAAAHRTAEAAAIDRKDAEPRWIALSVKGDLDAEVAGAATAAHALRILGLGLGLYIVSEIARSHGGCVQVTSTQETGTTFTVALPRSRPS